MKKIFLISVSFFALTSSCAFAMEDDRYAIVHKQPASLKPVTVEELQEYIYRGIIMEGKGHAIIAFDDFIEGMKNTIFTKEKKSVQDFQNRKNAFEQLQNDYTKSVGCFSCAFNNSILKDVETPVENLSDEKAMHIGSFITHYPNHEPYYRAFQNLTNQFLSLREQYTGLSLTSHFETLEDTGDKDRKVFLFKDNDEYVPAPLLSTLSCFSLSILYGSQSFPQKQFTFRWGTLIEDSGIILTPYKSCLKMLTQHGKTAEYPYTSGRETCRIPYDLDLPLMDAFKAQFGAQNLSQNTHFIPLPSSQEDQYILELLFLEDLIEDRKSNVYKFLNWVTIETERKEHTTLEARIQELEEKIVNAPQLITQNTSQESQVINNNNNNNNQTKKKKKTKGTPNKNQKNQNNNAPQKQQKNTSSSNKALENEKEKLLAKVKQEGRVKYRDILGIMNKVRSATKNEKIFNKFATIGRKGSHINFHLEDGEGLSLVKKHGKEDLTYPASQVNYFSKRLINAMFSID